MSKNIQRDRTAKIVDEMSEAHQEDVKRLLRRVPVEQRVKTAELLYNAERAHKLLAAYQLLVPLVDSRRVSGHTLVWISDDLGLVSAGAPRD